MSYITAEQYAERYSADTIDDLPKLLETASEVIDSIVLRPIVPEKLPEYALDCLKKATAAEAAYLDELGGIAALNAGNFSQATLGKFSFSRKSDGRTPEIPLSPLALSLLEKGGFLGRGLP